MIVRCSWRSSQPRRLAVGWTQTDVRAWYFGGVKTGVPTSSDTEEAYLLGPIDCASVEITQHAAIDNWTSSQPVITHSYPLQNLGPIWIHPQVLQTIDIGDLWIGQEITYVIRSPYTWTTFPYHTLPISTLFDRQPQREIVRLTYMLPPSSIGTAYFDAETGIALYYDRVWPTAIMFGVFAEINHDFERHVVLAEDDGPHTGYHSWTSERSQCNIVSGGRHGRHPLAGREPVRPHPGDVGDHESDRPRQLQAAGLRELRGLRRDSAGHPHHARQGRQLSSGTVGAVRRRRLPDGALCQGPDVRVGREAHGLQLPGFLLGDVSQNRVVTLSDPTQVNAHIAQVVTASNYLKDVNASASLTVTDKRIANTQFTRSLPVP